MLSGSFGEPKPKNAGKRNWSKRSTTIPDAPRRKNFFYLKTSRGFEVKRLSGKPAASMVSVRVQIHAGPPALKDAVRREGAGARKYFQLAWRLMQIQQPKGGRMRHANRISALQILSSRSDPRRAGPVRALLQRLLAASGARANDTHAGVSSQLRPKRACRLTVSHMLNPYSHRLMRSARVPEIQLENSCNDGIG